MAEALVATDRAVCRRLGSVWLQFMDHRRGTRLSHCIWGKSTALQNERRAEERKTFGCSCPRDEG